jgi:hypothetical protein
VDFAYGSVHFGSNPLAPTISQKSSGNQGVAILGCGPVGLFTIVSARLLDAGRIFAVDSISSRLAAARALGAEVIGYDAEDPVLALRRLTNGIERAIGVALNKNLALNMGICHHRKYIPPPRGARAERHRRSGRSAVATGAADGRDRRVRALRSA